MRYRDRLEKVQREQPGLIAEYQNMDRDYSVLRRNYEELLGRLQSANIAQAADTQADKVKLQIIDPPEIPRLPVAPNRMLLVTGVLLGGLATGVGLTILFGQLDRSFSTVDELRSLGLPVLGGISVLGLVPLRQRLMTVVAVRCRGRRARVYLRRACGPHPAVGGADLVQNLTRTPAFAATPRHTGSKSPIGD